MASPKQIKSGSWRIRWTNQDGVRQSAVFAERKDAVLALVERQREVQLIRRGLQKAIAPDKTFAHICRYWIDTRAPLKRSRKDDESAIRVHLEPAFGLKKLNTISSEDVDRFVAQRLHLHTKTIGNYLTLFGSMLRAAVELGWLSTLPKIRKPKARVAADTYSYLKDKEEIRRFLQAAIAEGQDTYDLYATAIMTGMREGEIAGLEWRCVDFDRGMITVRRSWEGATKNSEARHVPLMADLAKLLKARRLRTPGSLVFPNEVGEMHQPKARIFDETLHRMLDVAEFPRVQRSNRRVHYIVFHDLRHTFASHWMMDGGEIFKLQRVLGHKSISMTLRYAHLAPHAFDGDRNRLTLPSVHDQNLHELKSRKDSEEALRELA